MPPAAGDGNAQCGWERPVGFSDGFSKSEKIHRPQVSAGGAFDDETLSTPNVKIQPEAVEAALS